MENLILDIKISIAEKDKDVWWLFYLYFDDFKSYTMRHMSHYCQLFTRTKVGFGKIKYYYLDAVYIRYDDGLQRWYKNKLLHRDDGPTSIHANGDQYWYQHGKLHRDGGPAFIDACEQRWYQHGKLHRDGGPAVIDGCEQRWYQHGKLYRNHGHAIICKEWYQPD